MRVHTEKLKVLIRERYGGDYKNFSNALGMSSVSVWRVMRGKSDPGGKFLGALMLYCKSEGLSFEHYIFFEPTLRESNDM